MRLDHKIKSVVGKGIYVLGELPKLASFAKEVGIEAIRQKGKIDSSAIERVTAKSILNHAFSSDDLTYFRRVIGRRSLSHWALPFSFFRLPDGLERRLLRGLAIEHCHWARMNVVRRELPPAKFILDIGGAVDIHPEGALLAMGYPHKPKSIVIVDLPDEMRSQESKGHRLSDMKTANGVEVKYVLSSMSKLSEFNEGSFDLVWSGQSIEHVFESEADLVIEEVFRVLKPGGYFCLDTPNRKVTQLISKRYLHPDHKIEYLPNDLMTKLTIKGFAIEAAKAVTPLPRSLRLGRVSKLEIFEELEPTDQFEVGFSFFVRCRKPVSPNPTSKNRRGAKARRKDSPKSSKRKG
jgi:ubiquinone/menaquinone biosynthesis C-methylase UbiE